MALLLLLRRLSTSASPFKGLCLASRSGVCHRGGLHANGFSRAARDVRGASDAEDEEVRPKCVQIMPEIETRRLIPHGDVSHLVSSSSMSLRDIRKRTGLLEVNESSSVESLRTLEKTPLNFDRFFEEVRLSTGDTHREAAADDDKKKPDKDTLDKVGGMLAYDLANLFIQKPDLTLYRADIVFENRIAGKTTQGLLSYGQQMHLMRISGHLRFVFVRFNVMKMECVLEEGVIKIRWRVTALTFLKMILMYFPKKLYMKANLNQYADSIAEGISTFHVDRDGKIFRHVADNKMEDKEHEKVKQVDRIKEKLQKLKNEPVPAPTM